MKKRVLIVALAVLMVVSWLGAELHIKRRQGRQKTMRVAISGMGILRSLLNGLVIRLFMQMTRK